MCHSRAAALYVRVNQTPLCPRGVGNVTLLMPLCSLGVLTVELYGLLVLLQGIWLCEHRDHGGSRYGGPIPGGLRGRVRGQGREGRAASVHGGWN